MANIYGFGLALRTHATCTYVSYIYIYTCIILVVCVHIERERERERERARVASNHVKPCAAYCVVSNRMRRKQIPVFFRMVSSSFCVQDPYRGVMLVFDLLTNPFAKRGI